MRSVILSVTSPEQRAWIKQVKTILDPWLIDIVKENDGRILFCVPDDLDIPWDQLKWCRESLAEGSLDFELSSNKKLENQLRTKQAEKCNLHQRLRHFLEQYLHAQELNQDWLPTKWEQYENFIFFPETAFLESRHEKLFQDCQWFAEMSRKVFSGKHLARKNRLDPNDPVRRPCLQWLSPKSDLQETNMIEMQAIFDKFKLACQYDHGMIPEFWTWTRQLGVIYTWSPEYSMFSQGNIIEKERMSALCAKGQVILDLYAGIGYWAFPLIKNAGASQVICCDWNPYSLLALYRGSLRNNLSVTSQAIGPATVVDVEGNTFDLNAFWFKFVNSEWSWTDICNQMWKNQLYPEQADVRFLKTTAKSPVTPFPTTSVRELDETMQVVICPGNHQHHLHNYWEKADRVLLGMLPHAFEGIPYSVCGLQPNGGTLHFHCLISKEQMENFKCPLKFESDHLDIQEWFTPILWSIHSWLRLMKPQHDYSVVIERLAKVKSYAPKVYHCVADIRVQCNSVLK